MVVTWQIVAFLLSDNSIVSVQVEGETDAMLTIPGVDRDVHNGTRYTCAANNGAGMGVHGAPLPIIVWCK